MGIVRMVLVLAVAAWVSTTNGEWTARQDPHGSAPREQVSKLPEIAPLTLAPLEGYDDDASYRASIAHRASELSHQAESAGDSAAKTDLLLAAANLVLAYEAEPPCTRKLLRLADGGDAKRKASLSAVFDRADALLKQAETALTQAKDDSTKEGWFRTSSHRLSTLRAFSRGLRAFLVPADGAEASRQARRAASELSVLLEDDDEQVVAAANLWNAVLRSRGRNASGVRSPLPLALENVPRATLPYAFFSRLLRCWLFAQKGGHVAALALLTQIEDRCEVWLGDDAARADALRTTILMETLVLRDWYVHLPGPMDSPEHQWCVQRLRKLTEDHFPEGTRTVLRLSPAIPVVASVGDAKSHPSARQDGE